MLVHYFDLIKKLYYTNIIVKVHFSVFNCRSAVRGFVIVASVYSAKSNAS
jgi:hypothetical protein